MLAGQVRDSISPPGRDRNLHIIFVYQAPFRFAARPELPYRTGPTAAPLRGNPVLKPKILAVQYFRSRGPAAIVIQKRSGTGCIKPFEVAFTGRLFFTGLEGKEDAVGMVLADIVKTGTK
jgi:hypothetical protein